MAGFLVANNPMADDSKHIGQELETKHVVYKRPNCQGQMKQRNCLNSECIGCHGSKQSRRMIMPSPLLSPLNSRLSPV